MIDRTRTLSAVVGLVSVLSACAEKPAAVPEGAPDALASVAPPASEAPGAAPAASVSPPAEDSAALPPRTMGKRAPCTLGADQTCNGDLKVSALWGHCTERGVCECKPGFELNPGGFCQPKP